MKKIYKILAILSMTLFLITGLFTLMKKVGLCASGGSSGDVLGFYPLEYPLPIGSRFGSAIEISDTDIQNILAGSRNNFNSAIVVDEVSTNNNYITVQIFDFSGRSGMVVQNTNIDNFSCYYNVLGTTKLTYYFDTGVITNVQTYGSGNSPVCNVFSFYQSLPNNEKYLPYDTNFYMYPIWANGGSLSFNGVTYFENYSSSPSGTGHSRGGFISDYYEADSEVASDLPQVDTNIPAGSSNTDILGMILNGIGRVNRSIQGGFSALGGWLGEFIDRAGEFFSNVHDDIILVKDYLGGKLDDIKQGLSDLKDGTTKEEIANTWAYEFEHSDLYGFVEIKDYISTNYFSVLSNINAPQTLSFDVDLYPIGIPNLSTGNTDSVYLFGRFVHLDFGWYIAQNYGGRSIRDIIVPIVAVFLYIGMVYGLFFKLPSLIRGAGGWSQAMHFTFGHSGGDFMPTSGGIFTQGVSHNQPSLDKNPLSGSVFRFWQ